MVLRSDRRKWREDKTLPFDSGSFGAVLVARPSRRATCQPGESLLKRRVLSLHYYQFNIGDYASHTSHLDEIEDLAYRRMLDYCYLNEIGLPESVEEIARLIRMRTHCERIANVLQEFFVLHCDGVWRQHRVDAEIGQYREKSDKAKKAARKRWGNTDANALPTQSERNAKHKPLTINHKPIEIGQNRERFVPPTVEEVTDYASTMQGSLDADRFVDFYASKGWMVGKNKMKDWRAAVRTWAKRERENGQAGQNGGPHSRVKTVSLSDLIN